MKKTNKALAFILTLILSLSMLTVGAFAEPEDGPPPSGPSGVTVSSELLDFSSVANKEAVSVLVKLGLINGIAVDGGFAYKPGDSIDRAGMAKIVALAATLVSGDEINGASGFGDTAGNYADEYIAYCRDKGIVKGTGANTFSPARAVTVQETAAMLLMAMGQQAVSWPDDYNALAEQKGLYNGITTAASAPATRDDAARMVYNALTSGDGAALLPKVLVIAENVSEAEFTVGKNTAVIAPEGKLLSLTVNGVEQDVKTGKYTGDVVLTVTDAVVPLDGPIMGSYDGRGHEPYRAGIYVDGSGVVAAKSVESAVNGTVTDKGAEGISVDSTSANFSGIIVNGGEYTVKDSTFNFLSKSDGSEVSDFTGLGAVVAAYNGGKVVLDNVTINTEGVARPAAYADSNSDILIQNSKFKVMGGKLYDGYVNTADQTKMVAPPWVLGITGNARGTNLMGMNSTTTVVNSVVEANEWGVLSTDAGKDMVLTVVDSTLRILGNSGYGIYVIGNAQEYYYGAEFDVATYAIIMTGGAATFASSNGTFDVSNLKTVGTGEFVEPFPGFREEVTVTEPGEVVFSGIEGKGNPTVVNSKAFGVMAHNSGTVTLKEKTVFNTKNAAFLMKAGDVDIVVDDSTINAADGVIFQVIDNDDALVGAVMGPNGPDFNTEFKEAEGYPCIDYEIETTTEGRNTYTFTATNTALTGDFYNASGYFGGQAGDLLKVSLGKGASLNGVISASSAIHSTDGGKTQNTYFTINEYYKLGHVANKAHYNGVNDVEVVLTDGAVWTVTGDCYLGSLTVGEGCTLNGTVTVDGAAVSVQPGVTYTGEIVVSK